MRRIVLALAALAVFVLAAGPQAAAAETIGVVMMHGKDAKPNHVAVASLSRYLAGSFLVDEPDMPWAERRGYDVDYERAMTEIDAAVARLKARGATAIVVGPNGQRAVPVEQIVTGPGRTSLAKGEFILEVHLPKPAPRTSDAYLRFIPRTEMDIAVVGAGVSLTLDASGVITDARVALGAVAPTQVLVPDGAAAIIGSKLDDAALAKLDAAARAVCNPITDKRGTIDFRIKIAGVLARRTAAIAYKRAGG